MKSKSPLDLAEFAEAAVDLPSYIHDRMLVKNPAPITCQQIDDLVSTVMKVVPQLGIQQAALDCLSQWNKDVEHARRAYEMATVVEEFADLPSRMQECLCEIDLLAKANMQANKNAAAQAQGANGNGQAPTAQVNGSGKPLANAEQKLSGVEFAHVSGKSTKWVSTHKDEIGALTISNARLIKSGKRRPSGSGAVESDATVERKFQRIGA